MSSDLLFIIHVSKYLRSMYFLAWSKQYTLLFQILLTTAYRTEAIDDYFNGDWINQI